MILKSVFMRAFLLSLICAVGFAFIGIWIGENHITKFDSTIITAVQGMESIQLTSVMKFFTSIGSVISVTVIAIVILILLASLHYRLELLFFIGVIVGSGLLNTTLKAIFHRARPTLHRIIEENGYSFPSGHSMAAFSLYGILIFLLWKHIPVKFFRITLIAAGSFIILAIGISRIYLGVHYPSDIIGGYLASGTWLAFSIGLYQHFVEQRRQNAKLSN